MRFGFPNISIASRILVPMGTKADAAFSSSLSVEDGDLQTRIVFAPFRGPAKGCGDDELS
jgi:hypothetical protein